MARQELILGWTRDFTLAWAEWWQRYMHPCLVRIIGEGVKHQISVFNGKLLDVYRPATEAQAFMQAVVIVDPKTGFFDAKTLDQFVKKIGKVRTLIEDARQKNSYTDKALFKKILKLSEETYPWYTVCYLLPRDEWAPTLIEKHPKEAQAILERLIDARKKCEGVIEEFVEYWRKVAKTLLTARGLPERYQDAVTFTEIEKMLQSTSYSPREKELKAREAGYIFYDGTVFTGKSFSEFLRDTGYRFDTAPAVSNEKTIKGTVACASKSPVRGKVQVILRNDEVVSFQEGNILVTVMTSPFFVPAMKKAAAIVTDEGGITCHAAIVSRELKAPCVIGTKIATKVLKDGDVVEVNANTGVVRKL